MSNVIKFDFICAGEMEIINHKTGDKCHMKFEPYSYFGGIAKKVTGTVITRDEKVRHFQLLDNSRTLPQVKWFEWSLVDLGSVPAHAHCFFSLLEYKVVGESEKLFI